MKSRLFLSSHLNLSLNGFVRKFFVLLLVLISIGRNGFAGNVNSSSDAKLKSEIYLANQERRVQKGPERHPQHILFTPQPSGISSEELLAYVSQKIILVP